MSREECKTATTLDKKVDEMQREIDKEGFLESMFGMFISKDYKFLIGLGALILGTGIGLGSYEYFLGKSKESVEKANAIKEVAIKYGDKMNERQFLDYCRNLGLLP